MLKYSTLGPLATLVNMVSIFVPHLQARTIPEEPAHAPAELPAELEEDTPPPAAPATPFQDVEGAQPDDYAYVTVTSPESASLPTNPPVADLSKLTVIPKLELYNALSGDCLFTAMNVTSDTPIMDVKWDKDARPEKWQVFIGRTGGISRHTKLSELSEANFGDAQVVKLQILDAPSIKQVLAAPELQNLFLRTCAAREGLPSNKATISERGRYLKAKRCLERILKPVGGERVKPLDLFIQSSLKQLTEVFNPKHNPTSEDLGKALTDWLADLAAMQPLVFDSLVANINKFQEPKELAQITYDAAHFIKYVKDRFCEVYPTAYTISIELATWNEAVGVLEINPDLPMYRQLEKQYPFTLSFITAHKLDEVPHPQKRHMYEEVANVITWQNAHQTASDLYSRQFYVARIVKKPKNWFMNSTVIGWLRGRDETPLSKKINRLIQNLESMTEHERDPSKELAQKARLSFIQFLKNCPLNMSQTDFQAKIEQWIDSQLEVDPLIIKYSKLYFLRHDSLCTDEVLAPKDRLNITRFRYHTDYFLRQLKLDDSEHSDEGEYLQAEDDDESEYNQR